MRTNIFSAVLMLALIASFVLTSQIALAISNPDKHCDPRNNERPGFAMRMSPQVLISMVFIVLSPDQSPEYIQAIEKLLADKRKPGFIFITSTWYIDKGLKGLVKKIYLNASTTSMSINCQRCLMLT